MIDLYSAPTLNGMRAKITLDECSLPYRLHRIDTAKGDNKTAEFLALNPAGHVPVLVDHDGPDGRPLTLTHSVSILLYLADKTKRFIPDDATLRQRTVDALMNIAVDLGQTLDAMIVLSRSNKSTTGIEMFETRFRHYLSMWNAALLTSRYCAGDDVTIADFALISVYARCTQLNASLLQGFDSLERWAADMNARPGTQSGMHFG